MMASALEVLMAVRTWEAFPIFKTVLRLVGKWT